MNGITKAFDEKVVLNAISYSFDDTGLYLITGTSGSGKSTLLNIIAGVETPDDGTVESTFDGVSVAFQEDRLFPWYNTLTNASLAGDKRTAAEYLTRLGLGDSLKKHPQELSGGMRRRVSLARAFVCPNVPLILDEPFRGLDDGARKNVSDVICELSKERLVICATHMREMFGECNILNIENGEA